MKIPYHCIILLDEMLEEIAEKYIREDIFHKYQVTFSIYLDRYLRGIL